jgi:hypothetical protein
MEWVKINSYIAEYIDKAGHVIYETEILAKNMVEAKRKAIHYKMYALPYPGPGKLKTRVCYPWERTISPQH